MCVEGEGEGGDSRKMRERVKRRGKKDMNIAKRAFLFFDNKCCSMFHKK